MGRPTMDLTGQRFCRLVVIKRAPDRIKPSGQKTKMWECKCDCGKIIVASHSNLRRGTTKSCGCYNIQRIKESRTKDLTGQRFGMLTVIEKAENKNGGVAWKCKCDCGNTKDILGQSLRRGLTKSCGCLGYENRIKAHIKHGMTNTNLYRIWSGMKQRCNQKNDKRYKDYGGRGISYCREWEEFKTFAEWAYRSGYKDGLSIERINVNGNYCPENCEWIPFVKQARNRRPSLRIVGEDGKERLVVDIAEEIGIDANVVRARYESGWSLHDALYTPLIMQTVRKKVLKIDLKTGEVLREYASIGQAAKDVGVDRSSISRCCSGKLKKSGGFSWKYANKENE